MRGMEMRSGYVRCGLAGALISALLMVVYPVVAIGQNGAARTQYNIQNCEAIITQVNNAMSGNTNATQNEAVATVSNRIDAPVSVVNNCIQGSNNAGGGSGGNPGGGNEDPDDEETTGNEGTNAEGTDSNVEVNQQNCSVVINQYNNAVSGSVTADGEAAIAEVANSINAPISVVQNCIQGDGNGAGGDGGGGGTTPTDPINEGTTGSDANCPAPRNVATIGPTTENDQETFNITGDRFRVSYDVDFEDDDALAVNSFDIFVDGDFVFDFEFVDEDQEGSFIITEGPGEFTVDTTIRPDDAGTYTVTVDDCTGETANDSNDEDSVMDGTFDQNKTLANTGGETVGFVEASPLSSVMVPAGALLAVSSLAGMFWLVRRSDFGNEG